MRVLVAICASLFCWPAFSGASRCQTAPPASQPVDPAVAPTLRAEARLVSVPVVVRDKKGALVKGLTNADFALTVDGQPQLIRYFDQDNNLPLVLGLLVDTSMSQRAVLDDERTASTTFLQQMLTRNDNAGIAPAAVESGPDRAFVLQFAHTAELLQDVTDSKPKLQAALKQIDSAATGRAGPPDPQDQPDDNRDDNGRGGRGHGGYGHGHDAHAGTVLYDAVYLSANELTAKQKGRKALVILSDGDDHGSQETLAKAIEATQRADTVVYAIYFKGESPGHGGGFGGGYPGGGHGGRGGGGGGGYPGGGGGQGGGGGHDDQVDGKKVLQRMCDETGGRLFEVKGKQTVAAIYAQLGDELRSQYRLGYSPTAAGAAEGYHKVEVALPAQPKDYIQARDGYYGK